MTNKKIVIVSHYSQQPPYNTMLRYHNWAKELVNRGYDVTIVASSIVHNTSIDMIQTLGSVSSVCDGVKYIYVKSPGYNGNGLKRKINLVWFCRKAFKYIKGEISILVLSGPFLFPYAKRAYKNTPIIVDVCDLWPLSIVEYTGYSNNNPLIKLLYRMEKNAYLRANAVIFSMEGGKDYVAEQKYASKMDFSKIFHINMGCDIAKKDEELKGISFDLGWNPDDFNIVYCGSVRVANHVKQICDAAKIIEDRGYQDIKFQIYGNGDDLEALKQYVHKKGIHNTKFYGRIEKEKIPYILANGKANLLTYKNVSLWKYGGSQSKLFDYLASGRPIICNVKFGYNLIERYDCGIVAKDQSAEALAAAIVKIHDLGNDKAFEMGKRARKVAEMYDQPLLVDQLEKVFSYAEKKQ